MSSNVNDDTPLPPKRWRVKNPLSLVDVLGRGDLRNYNWGMYFSEEDGITFFMDYVKEELTGW